MIDKQDLLPLWLVIALIVLVSVPIGFVMAYGIYSR